MPARELHIGEVKKLLESKRQARTESFLASDAACDDNLQKTRL